MGRFKGCFKGSARCPSLFYIGFPNPKAFANPVPDIPFKVPQSQRTPKGVAKRTFPPGGISYSNSFLYEES